MMRRVSASKNNEVSAPVTIEARQAALAEGYRLLAADREREMEAKAWTDRILFDIEIE